MEKLFKFLVIILCTMKVVSLSQHAILWAAGAPGSPLVGPHSDNSIQPNRVHARSNQWFDILYGSESPVSGFEAFLVLGAHGYQMSVGPLGLPEEDSWRVEHNPQRLMKDYDLDRWLIEWSDYIVSSQPSSPSLELHINIIFDKPPSIFAMDPKDYHSMKITFGVEDGVSSPEPLHIENEHLYRLARHLYERFEEAYAKSNWLTSLQKELTLVVAAVDSDMDFDSEESHPINEGIAEAIARSEFWSRYGIDAFDTKSLSTTYNVSEVTHAYKQQFNRNLQLEEPALQANPTLDSDLLKTQVLLEHRRKLIHLKIEVFKNFIREAVGKDDLQLWEMFESSPKTTLWKRHVLSDGDEHAIDKLTFTIMNDASQSELILVNGLPPSQLRLIQAPKNSQLSLFITDELITSTNEFVPLDFQLNQYLFRMYNLLDLISPIHNDLTFVNYSSSSLYETLFSRTELTALLTQKLLAGINFGIVVLGRKIRKEATLPMSDYDLEISHEELIAEAMNSWWPHKLQQVLVSQKVSNIEGLLHRKIKLSGLGALRFLAIIESNFDPEYWARRDKEAEAKGRLSVTHYFLDWVKKEANSRSRGSTSSPTKPPKSNDLPKGSENPIEPPQSIPNSESKNQGEKSLIKAIIDYMTPQQLKKSATVPEVDPVTSQVSSSNPPFNTGSEEPSGGHSSLDHPDQAAKSSENQSFFERVANQFSAKAPLLNESDAPSIVDPSPSNLEPSKSDQNAIEETSIPEPILSEAQIIELIYELDDYNEFKNRILILDRKSKSLNEISVKKRRQNAKDAPFAVKLGYVITVNNGYFMRHIELSDYQNRIYQLLRISKNDIAAENFTEWLPMVIEAIQFNQQLITNSTISKVRTTKAERKKKRNRPKEMGLQLSFLNASDDLIVLLRNPGLIKYGETFVEALRLDPEIKEVIAKEYAQREGSRMKEHTILSAGRPEQPICLDIFKQQE